jgi:hypothetical protein
MDLNRFLSIVADVSAEREEARRAARTTLLIGIQVLALLYSVALYDGSALMLSVAAIAFGGALISGNLALRKLASFGMAGTSTVHSSSGNDRRKPS